MSYSEWKAEFVGWYARRNGVLVEAKSSMEMVVELQQRLEQADDQARKWMIQLFREWGETGDEFQKYDGRVMLARLSEQ